MKSCRRCPCRACWLELGFSKDRCAACDEATCQHNPVIAQACAKWLVDALNSGRVKPSERLCV